jgi:probable F420-dependent oxidoreductase
MARPFRFAVQEFSAESGTAWRDLARKVEDLGYAALHLADHYLGPGPAIDVARHPVQGLAAVPAMATAAAVTTTLRVGCRVFCVDYHVPAVLAKEAATLDLLSDGRLELGLGAGWIESEYQAMGVPFAPAGERIDRLAEVVRLVKQHATGAPIDVDGEHVRVSGYSGVPVTVQQPHPPIMIGGGARRVLMLAGAEADIVSLNFDNRSGKIGVEGVRSATAAATDERLAWIRAGAGDRFDDLELETAAYFTIVTDEGESTAAGLGGMFELTAEEMRTHPNALIGSVTEICEQLLARRDRFGISYVTVPGSAIDAFAPVVSKLAGA